jgi:hypothetical protein
MPSEDGRRLDEEGHRPPGRRESGGDAHDEALPGRPLDAAEHLPFGDDQLLAEHGVLRKQCCARPNQIRDQPANDYEAALQATSFSSFSS